MEYRYYHMTQLTAEQRQRWTQWLTSEQQQRMITMPPKRGRELLCGDGLTRELLAKHLGIPPQEVRFTYGENGKPFCEGMWCNRSHSGEWLLCAVSDRPIGVDIEQRRTMPDAMLRVLNEEERGYVLRGDRTERFLRLWTAKEAWIKCHGGHLGEFRRPILTIKDEDIHYIDEDKKLIVPPCPEGYVAAICERKGEE